MPYSFMGHLSVFQLPVTLSVLALTYPPFFASYQTTHYPNPSSKHSKSHQTTREEMTCHARIYRAYFLLILLIIQLHYLIIQDLK